MSVFDRVLSEFCVQRRFLVGSSTAPNFTGYRLRYLNSLLPVGQALEPGSYIRWQVPVDGRVHTGGRD